MDELGNQLGAAVVVSAFLEYLKQSKRIRFFGVDDSPQWKAFVSFLAALATTVGIHYTFDYDPSGHGLLTVMLPTGAEALHGVWDFSKQWAFQHFVYTAGIKDKTIHIQPVASRVTDAQGNAITGP